MNQNNCAAAINQLQELLSAAILAQVQDPLMQHLMCTYLRSALGSDQFASFLCAVPICDSLPDLAVVLSSYIRSAAARAPAEFHSLYHAFQHCQETALAQQRNLAAAEERKH
jgi:hypothetical protein